MGLSTSSELLFINAEALWLYLLWPRWLARARSWDGEVVLDLRSSYGNFGLRLLLPPELHITDDQPMPTDAGRDEFGTYACG